MSRKVVRIGDPAIERDAMAAVERFFDGITDSTTGVSCWACENEPMRDFIDDLLRGMARNGPYAQYLRPDVKLKALHDRVTDELLMRARGLPVYPRKISAFEVHCKQHRKELWSRVQAARKA